MMKALLGADVPLSRGSAPNASLSPLSSVPARDRNRGYEAKSKAEKPFGFDCKRKRKRSEIEVRNETGEDGLPGC
jgi:hypothetical protein